MANNREQVVIIEDDEIILEFLEMVFSAESIDVVCARNGRNGVEAARQHRPDVVVCDLHMAGMTGLDVLHEIRGNGSIAHTPFIMITADQNPALRKRSEESGADRFVLKPFDPDVLIEMVRELALKKSERPVQNGS